MKTILATVLFNRNYFEQVEEFNPENMKSVYGDFVTQQILNSIMERFDTDKNGTISYDEFERGVTESDSELSLTFTFA